MRLTRTGSPFPLKVPACVVDTALFALMLTKVDRSTTPNLEIALADYLILETLHGYCTEDVLPGGGVGKASPPRWLCVLLCVFTVRPSFQMNRLLLRSAEMNGTSDALLCRRSTCPTLENNSSAVQFMYLLFTLFLSTRSLILLYVNAVDGYPFPI